MREYIKYLLQEASTLEMYVVLVYCTSVYVQMNVSMYIDHCNI